MLTRLLRLLALLETFAQLTWSSSLRPLLLPLPLGEGWGEGLPGNHPGVTQRSLLAPRRRPRLLPILRSDWSQTGLFRSQPLHPNPSPRPRTQPFHRRPAAPSQPQSSSPTRPKNPAQAISRQPAPSGGGLARDSSPFTPTQFPPPATRPQPRPIPQAPLATPLRTAQPPPHRPGKTSPTHATPRSARRHAPLGASPNQPKTTPPHLKSFLEKLLRAREAPCRAPATSSRAPSPSH